MALGRSLLIILFFSISLLLPKQVSPANDFTEVKEETENLPVTMSPQKTETYSLEMPKIGVAEEIADNIDPFKMSSYMPAIAQHVAQAANTDKNLTYLFAHSSRYKYKNTVSRAIFNTLYETQIGDPVIINKDGVAKEYKVAKIETVTDTNLSPLTQKPEEDTVVLQTCWPPTAVHTRLIVTAKPASIVASR